MADIFETYSLQSMQLSNRIVRSATNDYCGGMNGAISEKQIQLYKSLAETGIGLIITGNFFVSEDGRLDFTQNAITEKFFDLEGAKRLVQVIHKGNDKFASKVVFQIAHAGRKTKVNAEIAKNYDKVEQIEPKRIEQIEKDFADAVERCADVGADGVQVHFGHGYLLGELLEERLDGLQITETVFSKIREKKAEYPVFVKVNTDINQERLLGFYKLCQKYGICAIELSGSTFPQMKQKDHNYYANAVSVAKKNCDLPIILTGGIRSLEDGKAALDVGADLIGMSRPFISEPQLLLKWKEKKSRCISCCQCFHLYQLKGKHCIFE